MIKVGSPCYNFTFQKSKITFRSKVIVEIAVYNWYYK